jgi:hypothetical protein
MKVILTSTAIALSLGLGGCMGAMHNQQHDAMMSSMMSQHGREECPNADQTSLTPSAEDSAAHQHSGATAQANCPPGTDQHEHSQPQN